MRLLPLILCLLATPAAASCGARGFGATIGSGATDVVAAGYTTAPTTTGLTLSAWVLVNGNGGSGAGRIVDQNSTVVTSLLVLSNNGGAIANTMAFAFGGTSTRGKWTFATPSIGAWHHVGVTFNGSSSGNAPLVYVDGSSVAVTLDTAYVAPGTQTTGTWNIGNNAGGTANWDGKLADVAYWNTTLTAAEMRTLGQGFSPLQVRPASLKMYLPLCGKQANEPDWASRLTQTITGAPGRAGNPSQPYPLMGGN